MLYNPLNEEIRRTLDIPVYYTGLSQTARVSQPDGTTRKYKISREYKITLDITLPARGYNWYVIDQKKPENEYDKGFNRACKVILDMLGEFNYRMEVRLENENEWLEPDYNYEDSKETKTKTKKLAVVKKQQK